MASNKQTYRFQPISLLECRKHNKKLEYQQSLGSTRNTSEGTKKFHEHPFEPPYYLINAFLYEGKFPNHFEQAFKKPVLNKNWFWKPEYSTTNFNYFRTIQSIWESIKKVAYLSEESLLNTLLFRFRRFFSTTDVLLFATASIRKNVDENEFVAAALLDLSKAFDSISQKVLLQKLKKFYFDEKAITMMESYLTEKHHKVTLTTCDLERIQWYQSFSQSTILGPTLFTLISLICNKQ